MNNLEMKLLQALKNQQPREATICNGAVETISGHLRKCQKCGARGTGPMPGHARKEAAREASLVDVRLANALRDARATFTGITSAISAAASDGSFNGRLIGRLTRRENDARLLVRDLEEIVSERGPLQAE